MALYIWAVLVILVVIEAKVKVALLVPVTSNKLPEDTTIDASYLFTNLLPSLQEHIGESEYEEFDISLYLGIDAGDRLFDQDGARRILKQLSASFIPKIKLKIVRMIESKHQIRRIWNELAASAYKGNNEYFIYTSDDAILQSSGFVSSITTKLHDNHGFGVVAFHELHKKAAAGSWPTFPCFSRVHLEIFGASNAFDNVLLNSYTDIYISDVYKIFNSAVIDVNAIIMNLVGGEDLPRYNPAFPGWPSYIEAVVRGRKLVLKYLNSMTNVASVKLDSGVTLLTDNVVPSIIDKVVYSEGLESYVINMMETDMIYGPEGYHYDDYIVYQNSNGGIGDTGSDKSDEEEEDDDSEL